jgi:hypothetical protein
MSAVMRDDARIIRPRRRRIWKIILGVFGYNIAIIEKAYARESL